MTRGRRWTDTETETLHRMRLKGHCAAEIAEAIGRTEDAVRRMCITLRVNPIAPHPGRKWKRIMTADELRTVRALFAANATRREVGEALGVAENDAVLICRHNGIGDEYTAAMKAAKTARQRGASQERSDLSEKAWLRMCAEGSAKLRDRVLALYRRERERKVA